MSDDWSRFAAASVWALDLDGVLWTGRDPIPGSAEAVARLRSAGRDVVFVTNNSFSTIAQQEAKLASFGIDAQGCVLNSAQAGASLVERGERVFVFGGAGIVEAVESRGAQLVTIAGAEPHGRDETSRDVDVVLVGLDWSLTYERLSFAVQAVLAGARFVATNSDPSYPTERGLLPGAGSLVAAVATATGVDPEIAGKPERPLADLVRARYGDSGVMIGDRPDTDGLFARSLGYQFGLVFSGVTQPGDLPTNPPPDATADNLAWAVAQALD